MPEIPVGYGQCTTFANATGDPEPMVVTMGFKMADGAVFDTSSAATFGSALFTALRSRTTSAYTWSNQEFIVGTVAGDEVFTNVTGSGVGAVTGNALPQNCAYLVRKRSGFTGRKNRGRCYVPGLREAEVSDLGVINASEVTALQTAWNTFKTTVEGDADFDGLAILHSVGDGTTPTLVTTLEIDNVIATQRRRMRR